MDIKAEIEETGKVLNALLTRDRVIADLKREYAKDTTSGNLYKELEFLLNMKDKDQVCWVFKAIETYDRLTEINPDYTLGENVSLLVKVFYYNRIKDIYGKKESGA